MSSRIKLPFKLGDSKKINEIEINETLKKEDFSLSEVRRNQIIFFFIKKSFPLILDRSIWFSLSTNNISI
jgi:hypothetical protein